VSRKILKKFETPGGFKKSYPQVIHRKLTENTQDILLTKPTWLYIILIMENKKETAKRPSKKVLMAQIEAKGVDKTIVASLSRANIETMVWVKSLLD